MMVVYQHQSALRFRVTIDADISEATSVAIRFRKPSGSTGEWAASVEDPINGVIYYDVISSDILDEVGVWRIWPYITFSDGRSAPGTPLRVAVLPEGEFL